MSESYHKIACPECKQNIEIPVGLFGESITCPHCNHAFVVPTFCEPKDTPPPMRGGVWTINRIVIGLGCLLAGCLLLIGFSARLDKHAPQEDEANILYGVGMLLAVAVWAKLFPPIAKFVGDLFSGIARWSRRQ